MATIHATEQITLARVDDGEISEADLQKIDDAAQQAADALDKATTAEGTVNVVKQRLDELDAVVVTTDQLSVKVKAEIADADIDALQVKSINGRPIEEGTILAKALSGEMVQTITGMKVYYQANDPTSTAGGSHTPSNGDTWYQTLIESDQVGKVTGLWVWSNGAWIEHQYDAGEVIRAGSITAAEISANYEYAGIVYADKIIVGSKESPKGGLNDQIDRFISTDTSKAYTKNVPTNGNYAKINKILGESVVSKNLFDSTNFKDISVRYGSITFANNKYTLTASAGDCFTHYNASAWDVANVPLIKCKPNTTYVFSSKRSGSRGTIYLFENGDTANMSYKTSSGDSVTVTLTTTSNAKFLTLRLGVSDSGNSATYWDMQVEEGASATSYEPHFDGIIDATPTNVTSSNGQSLSVNYGTLRSAGNVHDELDLANGKIIRRVGFADDSIEWKNGSGNANSNGIAYIMFSIYGTETDIAKSSNYLTTNIHCGSTLWSGATTDEFAYNGSTLFFRFKTSKTSGITLNDGLARMRELGAVCNYPLAEPIEEEINVTGTLLPVAENGTITFNNMGDDYGVQVPLSSTNEWWYLANSVRMDSFDSSVDAKIDNTVASVGESIQSVKDDVGSMSTRVESLDSITTTQASQISKLGEYILNNSLKALGYATIDNGTLTLGYRDNEWKLVARGDGIDLMYGSTTVGTFGKYGTNGSQLKANNSELQTVRFRSTQGGTLGLVTSSDCHVTLKEVR